MALNTILLPDVMLVFVSTIVLNDGFQRSTIGILENDVEFAAVVERLVILDDVFVAGLLQYFNL